jgi:UPF0176 protein
VNIVSFYRFLVLADPSSFRDDLQTLCVAQDLLGTVLVATEGFNGTLAGSTESLNFVLDWICDHLNLGEGTSERLDCRWTTAAVVPFRKIRVKTKQEIVTLGRPDILPHKATGEHVGVERWNALLDDPDVLLIDTRNHYEIEVGTFPGALDPGNDSFREFPEFAAELAEQSIDSPVAMFCTGGIRCEKATALMLSLGFDKVYQLQGGILNYLSQVKEEQNRWRGECFVFDSRVAVDRDLAEGGYVQCHACRRPLSRTDIEASGYREGVSCPHCVDEADEDRVARLEERHKQVALAARRGNRHIGPKISTTSLRPGAREHKKTL